MGMLSYMPLTSDCAAERKTLPVGLDASVKVSRPGAVLAA